MSMCDLNRVCTGIEGGAVQLSHACTVVGPSQSHNRSSISYFAVFKAEFASGAAVNISRAVSACTFSRFLWACLLI